MNDNSPIFEKESQTIEMQENKPIGTEVVQLTATDNDSKVNADLIYR